MAAHRIRQIARFGIVLVALGIGLASQARADLNFNELADVWHETADSTCLGTWTAEMEAYSDSIAWLIWKQKDGIGLPRYGQARANNEFPTMLATTGSTVTLTFRFADIVTDAPVVGPAVHHVQYLASVVRGGGSPVFVPVATSFTPLNSFQLAYTITTCEPIIQAIPYDAANNEIFYIAPGPDNTDRGLVALLRRDQVPGADARAMVLLAAGLMMVGVVVAGRRRASGS